MVIRAAIVDRRKASAQMLKTRLVMCSLQSAEHGLDIDIDISECATFDELILACADIDIAFVTYEILRGNLDRLEELHKKNPDCMPVPVGSPDEEICQYLALRPGGHLKHAGEHGMIASLCRTCAEATAEDPSILQITTRQGCYAVSTAAILYCMSDQKYVSIVVRSGTTYRKLAKLDDFAALLPDCFLRVHQRFLVNRRCICGIDKSENSWDLLLDSGDRIPISRVYQKTVDEQFRKLQFGCQK